MDLSTEQSNNKTVLKKTEKKITHWEQQYSVPRAENRPSAGKRIGCSPSEASEGSLRRSYLHLKTPESL